MLTQEDLKIENLDKFNFLDKNLVKNFVKNKLKNLTNYSLGEENLLISLATGLSYTQLILFNNFDKSLLKKIKKFLSLRIQNMPLNKIAKKAYFYLDEFYINNYVLAPRKETEILVERALNIIEKSHKKSLRILDMCCGSGAIGLSLAKHSKKPCFVTMVDVSLQALKVSKKNQINLDLINNVEIVKSDMFKDLNLDNKFDIIVSNPPYIKSESLSMLDEGVIKYDPKIALDGGQDGLKFYREIFKNAKNFLEKDGVILMEIGYDQKKDVENIFKRDYNVTTIKDYSENDRVIEAKLKSLI